MGSTYHSLYAHVFFHTKLNKPLIRRIWKARLLAYISVVARNLDVVVLAVGGVEDHVHLLIRYKPTHRISDILQKIKAASSRWVRESLREPEFSWQEGYTVLSVSARAYRIVKLYVNNQEDHHRDKSTREEMIQLLEESEIKYHENDLPRKNPLP